MKLVMLLKIQNQNRTGRASQLVLTGAAAKKRFRFRTGAHCKSETFDGEIMVTFSSTYSGHGIYPDERNMPSPD